MEEIGIKGLTLGNVSGKLERREKSCRKVLKMPENKLNDEKVLRMFVDRLIADKGGDTLDAKQKETLQGELMAELDERIQQAMIRALPDAKLMELEKMLDADASDEEIESFFANASKDAGVDYDPEIRKVFEAFRTDYFKDKIKVSVKTSALAPAASTSAGAIAASGAASAAPSVATAPAPAVAPVAMPTPVAGQPTQGTTSAVPGQSNVEGVANTGAVSVAPAQASAPVETPVQVVAPSSAVPVAEPVTPSAGQQPAAAQPTAVQSAQPAAAEEKPLQAAPNLMDALNTATANLDAAAANMEANSGTGANLGMAGNNMTENLGTGNAGAQVAGATMAPGAGNTNNTDLTGKEA